MDSLSGKVIALPFHITNANEVPRWRKSDDDIWSCAMHGRILSLRQDSTHIHYHATFPQSSGAPPSPPTSVLSTPVKLSSEDDDTEALVYHYLNLSPDLANLYSQWSAADSNFKQKAPKFTGVRVLKQDAWEALIGFICSSNNNIIRISKMVCFDTDNFLSRASNDSESFRWKTYAFITGP